MDTIYRLESNEIYEKVVHELINSLYCTSNTSILDVPCDVIATAKEEIIQILLSQSFKLEKIFESLTNKQWSRDRVRFFVNLLENSKTDLLYGSIIYHNSKYGDTLCDFDWFFKLVLGTNELNVLKYPLMQLKLTTLDDNGVQSNKLYDVRKNMLLKMIDCLEHILSR